MRLITLIKKTENGDVHAPNELGVAYEYGLRYEPYELPDAVKAFCIKFLQDMHLNFGCFDFIVTPQDQFVFLECNPNGQWLWIEQETGMPISQAIAEYLMKHSNI